MTYTEQLQELERIVQDMQRMQELQCEPAVPSSAELAKQVTSERKEKLAYILHALLNAFLMKNEFWRKVIQNISLSEAQQWHFSGDGCAVYCTVTVFRKIIGVVWVIHMDVLWDDLAKDFVHNFPNVIVSASPYQSGSTQESYDPITAAPADNIMALRKIIHSMKQILARRERHEQ